MTVLYALRLSQNQPKSHKFNLSHQNHIVHTGGFAGHFQAAKRELKLFLVSSFLIKTFLGVQAASRGKLSNKACAKTCNEARVLYEYAAARFASDDSQDWK